VRGRQAAAWPLVSNYASEPYIDGFGVTGDLDRKRDKDKEIAKPFVASSSREVWEKYTEPSRSLRGHRSMAVLESKAKDSLGSSMTSSRVYMKSLSYKITHSYIRDVSTKALR
jgi:hypothetical protein